MRRILRFALFAPLILSGCHAATTATGQAGKPPAPSPTPLATTAPGTIDSLGEMTATTKPSTPASLRPESFDYRKLLGDPPADNSRQHIAEIEQMLELQARRTPADVARCQAEVAVTAFGFANVLGPWFNEKDLPYTAQLMHDVGQQAKAVTGGGKKFWSRVRPPLADSRITPCVPLEKTFSYPSGHATIGVFWGTLLGEMFPDDRDILLARGKQIGFDRTIAGMHWPSDVAAGQKLGAEIARRMLADPEFRKKLDKAREECLAAMAH